MIFRREKREIIKINISFLLMNVYLIIFFLLYIKNKNKDLKVAICTMGKKENLYVKEFINYYIKLGIDHIFIYDDNDPNTEKISEIIDKSYKNYVTIYENLKRIIKNQNIAFTTCYHKNKIKFDWILFIDMDEYLVIVKDNLKNYLSNPKFKKCDFIKVHWIIPTDNNLLHYDNRSLFERFKEPYIKSRLFKTFVRGNIEDLKLNCHYPIFSPKRNITCNNVGNKLNYKELSNIFLGNINIEKAYIIHFQYKSTEEFIKKYKRGYSNWVNSSFLPKRIDNYFKLNKITKEKIEYIENELKLNLSKYKNNLETYKKIFFSLIKKN